MPTPLTEVLAAVPTLNSPETPIVYSVQGTEIVASWDVVNAQTMYPREFETIDRDFTVTVTFDERKGTFKTRDRETITESSYGGGGLSWSSSTFSGKKTGKSFSMTLGGVTNTPEGPQPGLVWSFDTARIKDPLFAFLEQHGWTRKRGLFG